MSKLCFSYEENYNIVIYNSPSLGRLLKNLIYVYNMIKLHIIEHLYLTNVAFIHQVLDKNKLPMSSSNTSILCQRHQIIIIGIRIRRIHLAMQIVPFTEPS